jgi:nucleoid DNA-binding protein
MAPKAMKAMKAMKGATSITKGALAEALATATELKKSECSKVLTSLAEIVAKEIKKTGKVVVPGVAMVKTRLKPATKAGKREVFGKVVMVKAKPARTIVKAYPVAAIKKAV